MHGKRLSLEAGEALPVSSVISVEYDDELFLGEVVSCVETEQGWNLQIKVEQILTGLQSLMALRARFPMSMPQANRGVAVLTSP